MELLPITILSTQQGVPLPNDTFSFLLSMDKFEKFEYKDISFNGAPLKDIFVIGLSEEEEIALNLLLTEKEKLKSIAKIGLLCKLLEITQSKNSKKITVKVLARAKLDKIVQKKSKFKTTLNLLKERVLPGEEDLLHDMRLLVDKLVEEQAVISDEIKRKIKKTHDLLQASALLLKEINLSNSERFEYLQYEENLDRITVLIRHLIELLDGESTNETNPQVLLFKAFLPEGMSSYIKDAKKTSPLPPFPSPHDEVITSSFTSYNTSGFPKEVAEKIKLEEKRLKALNPSSMEYQSIQDYLNRLFSIPWGKTTHHKPNLFTFIETLNKSHYGLNEVKDHLLEYITIENISGASKGTVLCFAGPPGVGKTSIAKQIATATNRQIVKIALGGMSDEAEIRGHRRTYVAAKPGRIIHGLVNAKAMDPLFLLDEVDKTSSLYKGDPVSALLELLDPEQNNEFIDRYTEIPVDLSKAMFICTANYIEDIPAPLKDRLEIISFREYTNDEKLVIAENYLYPKVIKDYSLDSYDIGINPDVYPYLCEGNSVREVERRIRKILRKATVDIVIHNKESVDIGLEESKKIFSTASSGGKIGF